ncbi:MAG: methylmalonyl Co-A mutase-associated GTPase MeaB [Candidatus Lokiarchaeota archaeon]|nr:methylmalonyl Co-A mutase-associated GTPase MeaB [Candidatus Lokiarchaeota archaeon]
MLLKRNYDIDRLIENFKKKDKVALARLITLIENNPDSALSIFKEFNNAQKDSYIIGITGSPGVGKSTLTKSITKQLLEEGKSVGIISVDPTSPFSGGAFLGDRVRMTEISLDPNVFIRSMASRGYKGGLSRAVFDISLLYEAFGFDVIIIETVGVGQAEFEVYNLAYSIIVVLVPGYGDVIQMQKAGIIEIGDIYDVNKMDLGGEDIAVQVDMMLDDSSFESGWRPPVCMTNANTGEGVGDLINSIWDHKEHIELSGLLTEKKKKRFSYKIKESMIDRIEKLIVEKVVNEQELKDIASSVLDNKFEIYQKVHSLFEHINIELKKE